MITSSIKRSFLISLSRFSFIGALLFSVTANVNAQTIYKVGSTGGTHTTISAAYAACSTSTNYIIEIMPNYGTIEVALGGITLGANTATSITIRPQAGNNSFVISTSITGAIFELNAATNVTIDGRPGGTGTALMILENKNATVGVGGMYVVRFSNGAIKNTVQYCTIKGANPNTVNTSAGVICFKANASNSNTIDNCTIGASTTKPAIAIISVLSDLGSGSNSNITISNCNIVDFTSKGIFIVNPANTGWNISDNSFYQTAAFTASTPVEMISIGNGSGYTINGNFLGGQAPGCGGSAYTITSGTYTPFKGIYFSLSGAGTSNTITNNTIQNISMTGNNYSSIYGFAGIYMRGSGTFICGGGSGLGNTIGSLSTANSIIYSNPSATGGIAGFAGIVDSATTSTTISYNSIGGIQINTGVTNAASDLIMVSAGSAIVDHNTIGSNTSPITHTNLATLTLINNTTSNFTATNNILQGISLTNATGTNTLYGIKNSGTGSYDCSDNTLSNITSANNGLVSLFYYSAASGTATFQTNSVNTISLTNTGTSCGLNVFDIVSAATATVDENIIGTTSANNISVAGGRVCNIIVNGGSSPFTVTDNTIQNISLSYTGAAGGFIGIGVTAGYSAFTCTGNSIQNISCATGNTIGYGSIYASVIATGLIISGNTVSNVAFTNTTAATINNGIYLGGSGTYGGTAGGNIITGLSNASSSATAKLRGIEVYSGTWYVQNNVVLLDNAAGNTAISVFGIDLTSTASIYIYSNTIKIYGTQTGALGSSACGGTSTSGTYTAKNNIFQNLRSGGTGSYYAENYPTGPTVTTNYNYVESSTPAAICKKGATIYSFTTWQSGVSPNSVTGTTTLDASGKVTSAPFAGAAKGSAPPPVATDIIGVTRSTTGPWMGAYEGVEILTSPVSPSTMCAGANIIVTYVLNGTFNASNIFTAQLSNAAGSFVSPVNIGSVASGTTTSISALIPAGTASGTGYRIRVIASIPAVTGVDNGTNLTINATVTPSVIINATATTVCTGTSVTFTPTPTNGGTSPFYQWQKNGVSIGGASSSSYTTSSIATGDQFSVSMNSNAACASPVTVTSAAVTITVNPIVTPSVAAGSSTTIICSGTSVSFIAAPSNGGTGPLYQWLKNAAIISGASNSTYATTTATNGDQFSVILTSNASCISKIKDTSNAITITVNPTVISAVTVNASATTICPGTNVTFTPTPTNGGTGPLYQWQKNGTNIPGASTSSYATTTATNGDVFTVVLTSNATCASPATATSPGVTITVNPVLTPSVITNATATTICTGANITFTPTPTNGGTSPFYQWQKNGTSIAGASTSSYSTTTAANGDVYSVVLTSNATCASPATATSPGVTITVNATLVPAVTATASATTICTGTSVTFTASPTNGGTTPAYLWKKNAVAIAGATNSTYVTSAIANSDVFTVVLTSSAGCASPTTATSTGVTMTVNPTLVPAVSITASATTICAGTSISFTPTPTNGGTGPLYQWQKNGTNIPGASTSSYATTTATNGDVFTVVLTSNATCASPATATSTGVTITVNPVLTPSVITNATATTICTGANVTFTPTPTNGGTSPFYQWQKNGTNIPGASTSSYATTTAANGDVYSVVLTSNATCASPATATSPGVTITVNATLVPAVTATASATTICTGTSVTFTASPTNGGTTPAYLWKKNAVAIAGATNSTYVTSAIANSDVFTVVLTSSAGCASPTTATSTGVTITVNPTLMPSVAISSSATTICAGSNITFTPTPTNGGTSPLYQWKKNGTNITGASTSSYATTTATNGDVFTVVLTSNATCASPATATSPGVTITVNPILTPSVITNATATTICTGANITFTPTPTNGGTSPFYQWQKNGTSIAGASTSSYATTTAANGDVYSVVLTSNATCASPATATSPGVTITVNATLVPAVTATASATTICTGTSVTFTASPTNGGTTPAYQWKKNAVAITGATNSTYVTSAIANSDVFTVVLTSSAGCASPTTATSTGVTMTVNPTLTPSVAISSSASTICAGTNITFTASPTNGGTGPLYQWQKNGTNIPGASTSSYATTTATNGDVFTVVLTSNATCASTAAVTSTGTSVVVNTAPVATAGSDISACTTGGAVNLNGSTNSSTSSQWASTGTGTFSNAASLTSTYTPSAADLASGKTKIILRAITSPCPTGTDTLTITYTTAPTIDAGTASSYCANVGSFTLNGSGASGTWSGGAGTYAPNATTANASYTPAASELSAGSVTLTYTSHPGLCPVVSDQVTFTFKAVPVAKPVTAVTICSGTATNITLSSTPAGASFSWTVSPVSGTVTGASASASNATLINQNLTVASGNATINYIVTPVLNSCTGASGTIPVTVSIPVISPATVGAATLGTTFSQAFTVTNMTTPVWTSSGSIPGMTINSGVLSGTPTTAATYPFTVTATQGLCTATQNYSLVVSISSTTWNGSAWSNGVPDATTSAIIDGSYTTTGTETFTANSITVNNGGTFNIIGASTVSTSGNFINNGVVNQQCTAAVNVKGSTSGNAIVIVQPVLSPTVLDNGTITVPYNQTTPFSLSFATAPVFTAAGLPTGLKIITNAGITKITGTPTVAGTYTAAVTVADGVSCLVNTSVTIKILNLTNPKLKFPQPTLIKTYGTDSIFSITASSQSAAPITYSISPANSCVTYNTGAVTISCVPTSDVWLVAAQAITAQYQAAKDSVKIVVNKATPAVSLLTLPGLIVNGNTLFDYQLPANYTGTASYDQVTGQTVASVDASGKITGLSPGKFSIDLQLTGTNNFFSLDTTFTFSVYDRFQPPTAVPDTVVLVRKDGVIGDGSVDLLKNDYGTTGHLRVNLTDIDVVNVGNQDIFYDPAVGTFQLNELTGVLTVHPATGLTATARIGYTITDSNGVTSDVAYVTIEIHNMEQLPGLRANEVMTPNTDGKNDVLFVGYTDINQNNEIVIMDAASNVIYKTSNYHNDWAGINTNGESVEAGVYYFVFTEKEGLGRQLKGFIEIVR